VITKVYKRTITATLHRLCGNSTKIIFVRRYANVTNAIKKGIELFIFSGHPGDVLEISHSNFGFQIATVKTKVGSSKISDMQIKFYLNKNKSITI